MNHNHIPRILALLLVIAMIVLCILLATPVRAAGQRIVDWPELPWEPDPAEVTALAQTLYGECRGCSELQQRAVCWCIFNRVEDGRFPDSVVGVITQPSQFFGYSATNPVWDSLYAVAYDCLVDWHDGAERVLEPEYLYFYGDGSRNHFTTAWQGGEEWCEG